MGRQCVICGIFHTNTRKMKKNCHFPVTKKEASLWRRTLKVQNTSIDAMQRYYCICKKHVEKASQRQTSGATKPTTNNCNNCNAEKLTKKQKKELERENGDGSGCKCELPINVLLMSGASLPTYCATSDGLPLDSSKLDACGTALCVHETDFNDSGAIFPDIDITEMRVLRGKVNAEVNADANDVRKKRKAFKDDINGRKDYEETDVLLLGIGDHEMDYDSCQCSHHCSPHALCSKAVCSIEKPCPPQPLPPPPQSDVPPCGCECEQIARRELNEIIEEQRKCIQELQQQLCMRDVLHLSLQKKLNSLYDEFTATAPEDPTAAPAAAEGDATKQKEEQKQQMQQKNNDTYTRRTSSFKRESTQNPRKSSLSASSGNREEQPNAAKPSNRKSSVQFDDSEDQKLIHKYLVKNKDATVYNKETRRPDWITTEESS